MSLHINRFVDLIKATEARGQRDLTISVRDAKDLHSDITKLLLALENARSQLESKNEVIEVVMDGGGFKNT